MCGFSFLLYTGLWVILAWDGGWSLKAGGLKVCTGVFLNNNLKGNSRYKAKPV